MFGMPFGVRMRCCLVPYRSGSELGWGATVGYAPAAETLGH